MVEFGDDLRHEVDVGISEEGNGGDERSAVVVDDFLNSTTFCCTDQIDDVSKA